MKDNIKKFLDTLWKIAVVVFILIIMLKISDYLHNPISSHIITVLYDSLGIVGIIICIIGILISCYDIYGAILKEKMKEKYHIVARNLREQIKRSIRKSSEELSCATLGQLLVVYYNDEEIMKLVINELKNRSDIDENLKSIVSYIFLENEYDSDFVLFFKKNPGDKIEFEGISHKIFANFVDTLYNGKESITERPIINDILIPLRHMCLPHNYIEKDKFVVVCRTLLDLIYEKLEKSDFENGGKDISIFLICIPLLQRKIVLTKIHNDFLDKKIIRITKSLWTRKAIKKAYIKIINALKYDGKTEYDNEEIAYCASLVSIYFDLLLPHQKIKLYVSVREFNNNITSAYHNYTEDNIILLLVCSSIFSRIKEQQDLLDEAMSLTYLCISETEALHSQIMEGIE